MHFEIQNGDWIESYIESNPEKVFIFEDNLAQIGRDKQNYIRKFTNTFGLKTKKGPGKKAAAFFNDNEFHKNIKIIDNDILSIRKLYLKGKTIVFTNRCYGHNLKDYAPKTFEYLCNRIKNEFNFDNNTGKRWIKIPGQNEISSAVKIPLDKKSANQFGLVIPPTNNYFRSELLEKELNTVWDLIKSGNKIAITSKKEYNNGDIILFKFFKENEYLICMVNKSFPLSQFSIEDWSFFEGYDVKYGKNLNIFDVNNNYYQTHFRFISSIDKTGKMKYKENIISENKEDNPIKTEKNNQKVLSNTEKQLENLSKEELILKIKELKSQSNSFSIPTKAKIFKTINSFFKKKDLNQILESKNLKGDISDFDPIEKKAGFKYYKLITEDKIYYLKFKRGLFKNKLKIILTEQKD